MKVEIPKSIRRYGVICVLLGLGLVSFGACASKDLGQIQSFSASKKALQASYIKQNFHTEFYCGIDFNARDLSLAKSPAYTPRKPLTSKGAPNKRASRIEFEHIMPAHRFGANLACWQKGGRKACVKDKSFVAMEADRRNLVPAIGEINGDRNNFAYAHEEGKTLRQSGQYGACEAYTDFKERRFYPRDEVRGIIARIYLYMSARYNIALEPKEKELMRAWDRAYPVSEYERALHKSQNLDE